MSYFQVLGVLVLVVFCEITTSCKNADSRHISFRRSILSKPDAIPCMKNCGHIQTGSKWPVEWIAMADLDGDGALSLREWTEYEIADSFTVDLITSLIRSHDISGDDVITWDEFVQSIESMSQTSNHS